MGVDLSGMIPRKEIDFNYLKTKLKEFEPFFILPEATAGSDPAWFGFLLTVREKAPFGREELVRYLNDHQVATRLLFAGNITRQPYFADRQYKISESLNNTDMVMRNTFWLGVYPKLTEEMLDYAVAQIQNFIQEKQR